MRTLACTIVLCASFVLTAAPALAQNKAAAEATFREGKKLMEEGKTAEACAKFAASDRLDPAIGTLANLARCHELIGQTASAWSEYNEAADRAAAAGDDRAAALRDLARKLEGKLSRLQIQIKGKHPDSLKVLLEGEDVTVLLGTAVPVDPGEYTIGARAEGYAPWEQTVRVEGEGSTITVDIPPLQASAPTTEPAPGPSGNDRPDVVAPVAVADDPGQGRRRIGYGLLAAGAVSTSIGLYFGLKAGSRNDEYQELCPGGMCPSMDSEGFALHDDATSAANLSNVFVGVGLAAAAGGLVLWLTAPDGPDAGEADFTDDDFAVRAAPMVTPDSVGAMVGGRF
jgi:hypothetical protein